MAYARLGVASFPRAVFLYVVVRPKMLHIMAGMAPKDSYADGFVSILAGFARDAALRAVFPLFLGSAGRRILATLAEEVQAALVVDNSGMFMVGFPRDDAFRAVFPGCLQAPDACHHVRYGPEGAVRGAVQQTADFPQLLLIFQVVDFAVVTPKLIPMVLATMEIPQLRDDKVVDVPMQVVQIFPVVVQRPIPMVLTVQQTIDILLFLFDKMTDVPVVQGCAGFSRAGRQHPCREARGGLLCRREGDSRLRCVDRFMRPSLSGNESTLRGAGNPNR